MPPFSLLTSFVPLFFYIYLYKFFSPWIYVTCKLWYYIIYVIIHLLYLWPESMSFSISLFEINKVVLSYLILSLSLSLFFCQPFPLSYFRCCLRNLFLPQSLNFFFIHFRLGEAVATGVETSVPQKKLCQEVSLFSFGIGTDLSPARVGHSVKLCEETIARLFELQKEVGLVQKALIG